MVLGLVSSSCDGEFVESKKDQRTEITAIGYDGEKKVHLRLLTRKEKYELDESSICGPNDCVELSPEEAQQLQEDDLACKAAGGADVTRGMTAIVLPNSCPPECHYPIFCSVPFKKS